MPLFAVAIFLSAFLLFQVQPLIARYILPWYGGSPAVWTTCLLFFQVGLLGGYAYAHGLVSFLRKKPKWQVGIHFALLALSFILLPITPDDSLKPVGDGSNPVGGILKLLAVTVGFPYLLLSASGPLLQHWFSDVFPDHSPYRLYAVSNLGSILGLLTYPFLFQPLLAVTQQTELWSFAYVFYALAAVACGVALLKRNPQSQLSEDSPEAAPPSWLDRILWVAFAACGSMLLLSLTNQMCQDVAVVPFLWVLPLSLYLLTFVISFDHDRWYLRYVWYPLAILAVAAVVYLINQQFAAEEMFLVRQISIFLAAIFCGCLVCHGEMVRIKPASRYLTGFYLAISLGGALGGLFVSLISPLIFDGYWELHVALLLLAVLATLTLLRKFWKRKSRLPLVATVVAAAACFFFLGRGLWDHIEESRLGSLASMRGFYGVLRVYEENEFTADYYRSLYHGRISHGRQYMEEPWTDLATTYYNEESGIGAAMTLLPGRNEESDGSVHIGVVGLGVGTIATYVRPGDRVRFYEINPQVEIMAREHFTFLADCKGEEQVVLGDARISLENEFRTEGSQDFDLLVVDAFSGDSIPLHLMTYEAFDLYFQHLKPDGILAVHISNLHLDLSDPVRNLAESFDWHPYRIDYSPDYDNYHSHYSDWVLISRDSNLREVLDSQDYFGEWECEETKPIHWRDDYCNLLNVVMWEWDLGDDEDSE
ncbi:MAG: fused MFS/spermidine synthase [Verrucomicrobiota bacterium]